VSSPDENTRVRIRRVPKFSVFLVVGGVLGVVVAFILTASFPIDKSIGFGPIFGYFALFGVIGGILVGAVVALVLERVLSRRARDVDVSVARLEPAPDELTSPDPDVHNSTS